MFTVSEMQSADPQIPICDTAWAQGSRAAIQASDSPNYLHPDCQTFPKKVLSVAVGLSMVLTYILNKHLNRQMKLEMQKTGGLIISSVRVRNLINI